MVPSIVRSYCFILFVTALAYTGYILLYSIFYFVFYTQVFVFPPFLSLLGRKEFCKSSSVFNLNHDKKKYLMGKKQLGTYNIGEQKTVKVIDQKT